MKTLKTLLAVSVLTAAAGANAAVYNYDAAQTITGVDFGGSNLLISGAGTGSAQLDTTAETLVINITGTTVTTLTNTTTDSVANIVGDWDGTSFTVALTGSTSTITGCTNNGGIINGCTSIALNSPQAFDSLSGSITTTGGVINSAQTNSGATTSGYFTLANGTPAVPVPAAAWLFGSGLLGLAGTARRRRNAAV